MATTIGSTAYAWRGTQTADLPLAEALTIVRDPAAPEHMRRGAQSALYLRAKESIDELWRAAGRDDRVGDDARVFLRRLAQEAGR